ncbi:uncharacterized protein B0H64DRAFT_435447 [Chaetomium fimeti]|uniref:Uncharacterized protein n=1 Tax=Chaetomium fimeti TaxID=1854472 RepID=A0AAE0HA57_9PEZI|nr:hypothetical protein B0H64DRAFT_435447 [Chaetomium fimeti]
MAVEPRVSGGGGVACSLGSGRDPTTDNVILHVSTDLLLQYTTMESMGHWLNFTAASLTSKHTQAAVISGPRTIKPRQWRPVTIDYRPCNPAAAADRAWTPSISLYQVTVLRGFHLQQHLAAPCVMLAKSGERGEPRPSAASILASIATLHIGMWFLRPLKLARALLALSAAKASRRSACMGKKMRVKPPRVLRWGPADENPVNTRLAQVGEIEAEKIGETGVRSSGIWLGAWTRRYGRCIKEFRNPAPLGPGELPLETSMILPEEFEAPAKCPSKRQSGEAGNLQAPVAPTSGRSVISSPPGELVALGGSSQKGPFLTLESIVDLGQLSHDRNRPIATEQFEHGDGMENGLLPLHGTSKASMMLRRSFSRPLSAPVDPRKPGSCLAQGPEALASQPRASSFLSPSLDLRTPRQQSGYYGGLDTTKRGYATLVDAIQDQNIYK